MVLYFPATGNTEFIAKEIAKRLNDECVDLLERVKTNNHEPLHSEKPFVICAPIYVCEIPMFMAKYLKEQTFNGSKDVYGIFTSGGYCGIAGVLLKPLFKKKGMEFHGYTEFVMPRNYVANDHYPMQEKEEVEKRIQNAYNQVEKVVADIQGGKELTPARRVQLWEIIVTVPFTPVWYKLKLTAKDFYVKDNCIGCGKCEELCPLNNIKLTNKKPVWSNQCTHCMACIGNCPEEAIEYGTITQEKRPYNFDKYRYVVENLKK